jgi:hypothetical protein
MDRREIAALLAYVDRLAPERAPRDQAAAAERIEQWAILLAHVPATAQHPAGPERSWDASRVAARYIATTPYPIKPSDVGAPWETYRADVIGRHWDPAPAVDPDNEAAYRAALRGTRQAVALGALPPTPQRAIEGAPNPTRVAREALAAQRLAALGDYIPKTVRAQLAAHRPVRAQREQLAQAGLPDALDVECTWCGAPTGEQCRGRAINPRGGQIKYRQRTTPHPCRVDDATTHHHTRQEQTA